MKRHILSSSARFLALTGLLGALVQAVPAVGAPPQLQTRAPFSDGRLAVGDVLRPSSTVGVFCEDRHVRLDLGSYGVMAEAPASHDSWATRLVIRRLDGPSEGPVRPGHVVGLFTENGKVRLDVGSAAMRNEVPGDHESWATRLHIRPLNRSTDDPVMYGEVVGVFSEDGRVRLDVGSASMKTEVPASHESWATRLRIVGL